MVVCAIRVGKLATGKERHNFRNISELTAHYVSLILIGKAANMIAVDPGHCPSGDDPFTPYVEEDCQHKTQEGAPGRHRGKANNRCHIDCSNRGICDYKTGKCSCFEGSSGIACDSVANFGSKEISALAQ